MKLAAREARAFLRRPEPSVVGVLLSGEDPVRVAEARAAILGAMVGPAGESEMRLERIAAAELRRDGSLLLDALKAVGFFPGPRAVLLEDATDSLAPAVAAALDGWKPGDARLVAAGSALGSKGALRKLFEGRRDAVAITLYDDPPSDAEVAEMLRAAGIGRIESAASDEIGQLASCLPPGEFRGLVERLALFSAGEEAPLTAATVRALAPQTADAEVDELLIALTEGRRDRIPPLLARLAAQGMGPVAITIQALRQIRTILAVASEPGGVQAGLAGLRPPLFGARRDALARAAGAWRRERTEDALRTLVQLDLDLRSGGAAPDLARLERVLLRLAG